MATESSGRTFIGTVVCIDLVGYSTRSVEQQIAIKALFNRLLAKALKPVPAADRVILDTGDGAAVTLMGDPEPALDLTAEIRRLMGAEAAALGAPNGAVRIAVNLGSVRVGTDMNGYPKLVGDALNVAQGLLVFAAPGQAVVSRSFHEVVASLSAGNAARFTPLGWRKDGDGREHEIHALAEPAVKEPAPRREPRPAAEATGSRGEGAFVAFLRNGRLVAIAAGVLIAVIALEAVMLVRRGAPAPAVAAAPAADPAPPAKAAAEPPTPVKAAPPEKPAPRVEAPPSQPPLAKAAPVATPPAPPQQAITPPPAATIPASPKAAPPEKAATPEKAAVPEKPAARKPADDAKKPAAKAAAPKKEEPAPVPPPAPAVVPPPAPAVVPPPTPVSSGPPTPTFRAPVSFPVEAARKNIDEGVVRARVTVDAAGAVTQVRLLDSKPPRVFDNEALRSLRQWKFDAGTDNRSLDVEIAFKR